MVASAARIGRGGHNTVRGMRGTATFPVQGTGVNFASNVPTTARSETENALLSRMKKYPPGIPSINSDIPFGLLK